MGDPNAADVLAAGPTFDFSELAAGRHTPANWHPDRWRRHCERCSNCAAIYFRTITPADPLDRLRAAVPGEGPLVIRDDGTMPTTLAAKVEALGLDRVDCGNCHGRSLPIRTGCRWCAGSGSLYRIPPTQERNES